MALKGETTRVEPSRAEHAWARRVAAVRATVPELTARIDAPIAPAGDLLYACARALRTHPRVNGAWRDGAFELYGRINIGVELDAGTPTIFDADEQTPAQLAAALEQLRGRELAPPELAGATFTVAWADADAWSAPPHSGQAALLAVGSGGALTLCCDARALSVATAAAFLRAVAG
ncbi:MAG: hypothetical protein NVSMB51_04480 [Solirubrobacteraceae bacterium]